MKVHYQIELQRCYLFAYIEMRNIMCITANLYQNYSLDEKKADSGRALVTSLHIMSTLQQKEQLIKLFYQKQQNPLAAVIQKYERYTERWKSNVPMCHMLKDKII